VPHDVKAALSSYIEAEAVFRRSLDAGSDRLILIGKAVAVRNAALDRYKKAVERLSVNKPKATSTF
jgi:hypothetical protein